MALAAPADTADLARRFKAVRRQNDLPPAQYRQLREVFLLWLDSRVKAGAKAKAMNAELDAAGLVFHWPDPSTKASVDEISKTHAGYLEVKDRPKAGDIRMVIAEMYTGTGCSLDSNVVLYEGASRRRLAVLNEDPETLEAAAHVQGVAVGAPDASGDRLVATGWTFANCTSTWNGKSMRIDRLSHGVRRTLLHRGVGAQSQDDEDVQARIDGDVVTFRYHRGLLGPDVLTSAGISRFRVGADSITQVPPIDMERAGFIDAWLDMSDAEAARWADPDAVARHREVAAAIHKSLFEITKVTNCDPASNVLEMTVQSEGAKLGFTFRLRGSHCDDLRLLAISDEPSAGCRELKEDDWRRQLYSKLPALKPLP